MGTEDVKVTAIDMYKYKERLRFPTLVRVFLCPCVGPVPLVGLTLTWFTWDRNLALHVTLHSLQLILGATTEYRANFSGLLFGLARRLGSRVKCLKNE